MIKPEWLLFIEPSSNRTIEPIIDSYTKKMTASLRKSERGTVERDGWMKYEDGGCYFGTHGDSCRCISDSTNRKLSNGEITNSLCIHYLAFHRWEISEEQLNRVASLLDGEEEPTIEELWPNGKYPKVNE
jgi:hypothetical protein